MSNFSDELKQLISAQEPAVPKRPRPPRGWEPGFDTESGQLIIESDRSLNPDDIDWQPFLDELGVPAGFKPAGMVHVRAWDAAIGNQETHRMYYYKCDLVPDYAAPSLDYQELKRRIRTYRPRKSPPPGGDWSFVVGLADWQLGKRDGDGTEGVVSRVLALQGLIKRRYSELRKLGIDIGEIVVAGMGDLVEGCGDVHYPNQSYMIELNRRQQINIARRLLVKTVKTVSDLVPLVTVVAVPGNHGENRKGKMQLATDLADNDDVAVFEQVQEIFGENPERFGHIRFAIPHVEQAVVLDCSGTLIGFTHGHRKTFGGGGKPVDRVKRWWKDQSHGMRPVGEASILVSGHYHHLHVEQNGPRTHIQCPSLESRSEYVVQDAGLIGNPGTLTFATRNGEWDYLRVLR